MPKAPKECSVHRLVADVAPLSGGKVLLVRYKDVKPYDGQKGWFLPDDFLALGEHPQDAAKRILREQAGIAAEDLALSHIESFTGGPSGAWHLIFHFRASLKKAPSVTAGKNVADAQWFPLEKMPARKDVSHGGWAIDVLEAMLGEK